jgi:hypothetical protein
MTPGYDHGGLRIEAEQHGGLLTVGSVGSALETEGPLASERRAEDSMTGAATPAVRLRETGSAPQVRRSEHLSLPELDASPRSSSAEAAGAAAVRREEFRKIAAVLVSCRDAFISYGFHCPIFERDPPDTYLPT